MGGTEKDFNVFVGGTQKGVTLILSAEKSFDKGKDKSYIIQVVVTLAVSKH